jgi:alpha-L-rhamnosidase
MVLSFSLMLTNVLLHRRITGMATCLICMAGFVLMQASAWGNAFQTERATTLTEVRKQFASPPSAYGPAPLYVWNDDIQEDEIVRQLDLFNEQGMGGVFIHPRPGLVTPYLSKRWLELCRFTVQECRKRNMYAHLYDENSYPSGFAGGHVPEAMPSSRFMSLHHERITPNKLAEMVIDSDTIALYRDMNARGGDDFEHVQIIIEPDGVTGRFIIDGSLRSRFRFQGKPLTGGFGMRAIVGRNCKIDDFRIFQLIDNATTIIMQDDFNRAELGGQWINESLMQGVGAGALKARIENGVLVLEHDGTGRDSWLRTAKSVLFEGKTTVFEFRLIERYGKIGNNPSLVVGAQPYKADNTSDVVLIDMDGSQPKYWNMVDGAWAGTGISVLETESKLERVKLPPLPPGEKKSAKDLGLEPGTYLRSRITYGNKSAWLGGRFYTNLIQKGVTDKFVEITLGAYDTVLKEEYGKTVPSCFTDEPHGGSWAPDLPEVFRARWGYDLLDHLPSLTIDTGNWRQVRHDYSSTLLELFVERFAKPYYMACDQRGIALTGHVWEHEWPRPYTGLDTMSFNAWEHIPGIDCLMNGYGEGTHAQLGNFRMCKEISSIKNQFGRTRTLCEAYGAGGWEMTMQDMKRIGDWLYVGGINLLNPHLSYYTIRGARKRDHPLSFSYHAPWWEAYHLSANYFSRLSWALAAGWERNDILLIEPTTTMWMYSWCGSQSGTLDALGNEFQRYVVELGAAQVGFDLGSEPVMAASARVVEKKLVIGERPYRYVVLPPGLQNLESSTVRLLEEFVSNGGTIMSRVGVPAYVDGRPSDKAQQIKAKAGNRWIEKDIDYPQLADGWGNAGVRVTAKTPKGGRVFHHLRQLNDGLVVFVVNTSLESSAQASVVANGGGMEQWNPADGKISSVSYSIATRDANGKTASVQWDIDLPPAGSAMFAVFANEMGTKLDSQETPEYTRLVMAMSETKVKQLEPNVLPLDYVDLILKGETTRDLYFYDAQRRIYRAHGFRGNPWDSSVQYKDELLQRDHFPADSGFELRYRFNLDDFATMPSLKLVVERGDRYIVAVNGHSVKFIDGESWLDKSFNVYTIKPEWLKPGENTISTAASPFSIHHEPEPVYLLGEFNLASAARGWTLTPAEPLKLGLWSKQGRPCYSEQVAYTRSFTCEGDARKYVVELGSWQGSVARVDVNGKSAGYIAWQPWSLDITDLVKTGGNEVTVVVFGTLKNLLGPHHNGPGRGSAWPGMFQHGPKTGQPSGDKYDVIQYGLNKAFSVCEYKM